MGWLFMGKHGWYSAFLKVINEILKIKGESKDSPFSYAASLHQSTKQVASLLSIHIYQKLFRNMLNHMQHFMAKAVHIFCFRSGPADYYHRFSDINIRIGYPFVRFTFEHEITGIFERNADASQIPKIPSYLHVIL